MHGDYSYDMLDMSRFCSYDIAKTQIKNVLRSESPYVKVEPPFGEGTMSSQLSSDAERLWDAKACAAYLGKSSRWLWSAIKLRPEEPGSVPHVRIGKSPRFLPRDIEAWVRQGCPPAATFAEWNRAQEKRAKCQ